MKIKKFRRKIISVILAATMMASLLPASLSNVSAANDAEGSDGRYIYTTLDGGENLPSSETASYASFTDDTTTVDESEDTGTYYPTTAVDVSSLLTDGIENTLVFTGSEWAAYGSESTGKGCSFLKSTEWSSDEDGQSVVLTALSGMSSSTYTNSATYRTNVSTLLTGLTVGTTYTITFDYKLYDDYVLNNPAAMSYYEAELILFATSTTTPTSYKSFVATTGSDRSGVEDAYLYNEEGALIDSLSKDETPYGLMMLYLDGTKNSNVTLNNDGTSTGTVTYTFIASAETMLTGFAACHLTYMSGYEPSELWIDNVRISADEDGEDGNYTYTDHIDDDWETYIPYILPYSWDDDTFESQTRDELTTEVKSFISTGVSDESEDYSLGSFETEVSTSWNQVNSYGGGDRIVKNTYYSNRSGSYMWNPYSYNPARQYITTTVSALAEGVYNAGISVKGTGGTIYLVAKLSGDDEWSESDLATYEMTDEGYLVLGEFDSFTSSGTSLVTKDLLSPVDLVGEYTYAEVGLMWVGTSGTSGWANVDNFWLIGPDNSDMEAGGVRIYEDQVYNGDFEEGLTGWTVDTIADTSGSYHYAYSIGSETDKNGETTSDFTFYHNSENYSTYSGEVWDLTLTEYITFTADGAGEHKISADSLGVWNEGEILIQVTGYDEENECSDGNVITELVVSPSGSWTNWVENASDTFTVSEGETITVQLIMNLTGYNNYGNSSYGSIDNIQITDADYEVTTITDQFANPHFAGGGIDNYYWHTESDNDTTDYVYGYGGDSYAKIMSDMTVTLSDESTYELSEGDIIYITYTDSGYTTGGAYTSDGSYTYLGTVGPDEGSYTFVENVNFSYSLGGYLSVYNNSADDSYVFEMTQDVTFTYDETYRISALLSGWLGTEASGATEDGYFIITATDEEGNTVFESSLEPYSATTLNTVVTDESFTVEASEDNPVTYTFTFTVLLPGYSYGLSLTMTDILLVSSSTYHGLNQFENSNFEGGTLGSYWSSESENDDSGDYTYGYSMGTFAKMLTDNEEYGLSEGDIIYPQYSGDEITGYYADGSSDFIDADSLTENTDWEWTDDGYINIYNNSDTDSYVYELTQIVDFTYDSTYAVSALLKGWLGTKSEGATEDGSIMITAYDEEGNEVYAGSLTPESANEYAASVTDETFTVDGATEDNVVTYTFIVTVTLPGYAYGINLSMADIILVEPEEFMLGISTDTEENVPAKIISGEGEDEMYVSVSASDISSNYSTDEYPVTTVTYTDESGETCGYVFAGWYSYDEESDNYTVLSEFPEEDAVAKFVDENVLTVKAQLTSGTTAESETTSIRFVSTVDTLDYDSIGFKMTFNGKTSVSSSTKVYTSLTGSNGTTAYEYAPTVFSSASVYFFAYTIKNVPNSYFDETFEVTPYWTTLDGTTVYGTQRDVVISELL